MLLFLDLCLELEGAYVGRKRRNQAKNKVEQNAAYCHGVDNVFLDVSAALSLQAVRTGTVCFHHMRGVIICIPYHLPHILLCALSNILLMLVTATARETGSTFYYMSSKEHLHCRCKRQVKFLRSFVSLSVTLWCLLLPRP